MTLNDLLERYQEISRTKPNNHQTLADVTKQLLIAMVNEKRDNEAYGYASEYLYHVFYDDTQHLDESFYCFRSVQEYSLNDLKEETLSLVHPSQFNDPMDFVFLKWLQYHIATAADETSRNVFCLLQRAANHIRIRSLVEANQIQDINPLMWAHYANNHKGFCIKYKIPNNLVRQDIQHRTFVRIGKIDYTHKNLNITDGLSILDALLWKGSFWSYENESRLIYYNPSFDEMVRVEKNIVPEAVFLGLRCSLENRAKIMLSLANKNVAIYQMVSVNENLECLKPIRIG